MLTEPTIDKLKELALYGMAQSLIEQEQTKNIARLSFDDRLALLVDAEWIVRQNRRLDRRLKEAKLRIGQACIEDVQASRARGLEKSLLLKLASCAFIADHLNVLITGATGTGKTYVACALAQQACRKGHRALYRRASRLYEELALARVDGSYPRVLARIARMDVLVLDDFGLTPMREQDRHALLDVLEDRYGNRSIIITAQLPIERWHEYIGEASIADAICDRVIHNAYRVPLKGASRRKEKKNPLS